MTVAKAPGPTPASVAAWVRHRFVVGLAADPTDPRTGLHDRLPIDLGDTAGHAPSQSSAS